MAEPSQRREYRTSDLALATTLRARGHEPALMEVDKVDSTKVFWIFYGDGPLHRIVREYHDGDCRIEPRRYNTVLRRTRSQLYAFMRDHGIRPTRAPS